MTKIVAKDLPNAIATSDVTDATVRKKVMLLNENIKSLASQLKEAQKALVELQGGSAKVNLATLATDVAPLVEDVVMEESATAYQSAQAAASSATAAAGSATTAGSSATAAGTSETNAGTSETNAATSETNALTYKNAAEAARDRAEAAAEECVWHSTLSFTNLALSLTALSTGGTEHPYYGNGVFNLSAIVPDTSKSYVVSVRFVSTLTRYGSSTAVTRWFRLLTNVSGDTEVNGSRTYSTSAYLYPGELILDSPLTKTMVGTASFYIVNGTTSQTGTTGLAGFSTIIDISEA